VAWEVVGLGLAQVVVGVQALWVKNPERQ